MPELPEVETVSRELNTKLKNRRIKSVLVFAPKIIGFGSQTLSPKRITSKETLRKFTQTLKGQKFLSVNRRAKLLIFDLSGPYSMFVHLKMTGQFIFEDKVLRKKTGGMYRLLNKASAPLKPLPDKHTHVIFEFIDSSKLYFNDVRKFGYLKLVRDSEIDQIKELKEFGPEPLDKNFTFGVFEEAVKKRANGIIKEVLIDSKVVAGIGNIYSDEIIFHAGVRPGRKVLSLSSTELKNIYRWIKPVLLKGIKAKGSSVGDFITTDGSTGKMGSYHYVYGRKGQKCKNCGTLIETVKFGGRTASYCPRCQK